MLFDPVMPPYIADIINKTHRLRASLISAFDLWSLLTFLVAIIAELWSEVMDTETKLISPADYIGFYGDPFNVVGTASEQPWKGKGKLIPRKAVPTIVHTDESIDWTKYDPPSALRTAPTIESEILLQVITSSIDRVKTRLAEDRVKRQESAARRQREAAHEQEEADHTDAEPYLPIIIPPEAPTPSEEAEQNPYTPNPVFLSANGEGSSTGAGLIIFPPVRPKKNYRLKISRFLRKRGGKDEDAATLAQEMYSHSMYADSSRTITSTVSNTQSVSGVVRPRTPDPEPVPVQQVECVSCLDDFPITETVKAPCHHYCHECFERLITAACQNEQQWPPKCCLNDIPVRTIRAHIPNALTLTYNDRSAEWSSPIADRIYCSLPNCSLFVPPSSIDRANRIATCTDNHRTCTLCREPYHLNAECPRDRDVELTEALAEEEGWLHCSRCRALVEHREACQHMTCRCGYQFCYVCSAVWQTCRCTMGDLQQKKQAAEVRRQERQQREAQADAELQEALRQIAEFEREEALKAELLRQEMERQEEERRQHELEERIRLESIRRGEVEMKFAGLRGVLADLHALQKVWADQQHEWAVESLKKEAEASSEALKKKHELERAALDAKVVDKLATREATFLKEYAMRVAEEKTVEESYLLQLSEFYAEKTGGEERIAQEMTRFRRKMDRGWRSWKCWRDEELAVYRARVEEERTIKDELMFSAEQRHGDAMEEREKDLVRRKTADGQWVELVIAERERMLDEMEMEELNNGDDAASLFASSDEGGGCG